MSIGDSAGQAVSSGREGVDALVNWFALNRAELPIGLAVAAGIVLVMLALRWIGGRLVAGDPRCTHWRGVIGRVLATDVDPVHGRHGARHRRHLCRRSDPDRAPDRHPVHGRLRPARRDLGARAGARRDQPQGRRGSERNRARQCHGGHPRAGQRRLVRARDHRHPRQSRRQRHRAGRRPRHRRHRHRPRRAGHLLRPVRGAFDPVRQARSGAATRSNYDQTTGTVERIGLKTTRLRSVNGEQVVMANTKLLEREIHNFNAGRSRRSSLPFGLVYQTAPDELEKVPSLVKGGGRSAQRLHASFAAPSSASARRASTSSCS